MFLISFLVKLIIFLLLIALVFGFYQTWKIEHAPEQALFLNGNYQILYQTACMVVSAGPYSFLAWEEI